MTSSKPMDASGRLLLHTEPPSAGEPFEPRVCARAAALTLVRPQDLDALDAAFAVLIDCDERARAYQRLGKEGAPYIAVRYNVQPDEMHRAENETSPHTRRSGGTCR